MNWRLWTTKDVTGVLIIALLVGGMFFVAIWHPHWRRNFGFGRDWQCVTTAPTEPVCMKKPAE